MSATRITFLLAVALTTACTEKPPAEKYEAHPSCTKHGGGPLITARRENGKYIVQHFCPDGTVLTMPEVAPAFPSGVRQGGGS